MIFLKFAGLSREGDTLQSLSKIEWSQENIKLLYSATRKYLDCGFSVEKLNPDDLCEIEIEVLFRAQKDKEVEKEARLFEKIEEMGATALLLLSRQQGVSESHEEEPSPEEEPNKTEDAAEYLESFAKAL